MINEQAQFNNMAYPIGSGVLDMGFSNGEGTLMVPAERSATVDVNEMHEHFRRMDQSGGEGRPTEPYSQVAVVYACVQARIEALSRMTLMVSTDDDQVIENGPMVQLLNCPNPDMTQSEFVKAIEAFLLLAGGRVHLVFDNAFGAPSRIDVVPGYEMKIVRDQRTREVLYYEHQKRGTQIKTRYNVEEVHTIVDPNYQRYDIFEGLGPLVPAMLSISQFYKADVANESSLDNGVVPGGMITTDQKLTREQRKEFKNELYENFRGPNKRQKLLVGEGGVTWNQIAATYKDMEFKELKGMSRSDICAIFRAPPAVIGYYEDSNYAHADAAQGMFWENTMLPRADWIAEEITRGVLKRFVGSRMRSVVRSVKRPATRIECRSASYTRGAVKSRALDIGFFAWFDSSMIAPVQAGKEKFAKQAETWAKLGVPLNVIIRAFDLPFEEMEWGDTAWMAMGLQDIQEKMANGTPAAPDGSIDDTELELLASQQQKQQPNNPDELERSINAFAASIARHAYPGTSDTNTVKATADISAAQTETRSLESSNNAKARSITNKQLDAIHDAWYRSWEPLRKTAEGRVRRRFMAMRSETLKNLKANEALFERSADSGANQRDLVGQLLFSLSNARGGLADDLRDVVVQAVLLGGEQVMSEDAEARQLETPLPFNATSDAAKKIIAAREFQIKSIPQRLHNKLRDEITTALSEGKTVTELREVITSKFNAAVNRAASIAQTELGSAIEAARSEARRVANIPAKSWLWSRKETTGRASHEATEVATMARPVPANDDFTIAGTGIQCPHPRATGRAAHDINCGCTTINRYPNDQLADQRAVDLYMQRSFLSSDDLVQREAKEEQNND